jgi:hypothetical protein
MANERGQRETWEWFYDRGENPNGFRAVTPNGTATDQSPGENHQWTMGPPLNGPRWTLPDPQYPRGIGLPVGRPGVPGTGRSGNRNRSAE